VIFIYDAHTDVGGVSAILEDAGPALLFLLQVLYPGRVVAVDEIDEILDPRILLTG
jgi:hypothetical protein